MRITADEILAVLFFREGGLGRCEFCWFCVITASVHAVFGANLDHAQMELWLGLRLWLRGGGNG